MVIAGRDKNSSASLPASIFLYTVSGEYGRRDARIENTVLCERVGGGNGEGVYTGGWRARGSHSINVPKGYNSAIRDLSLNFVSN